jgi:hypothetical protein
MNSDEYYQVKNNQSSLLVFFLINIYGTGYNHKKKEGSTSRYRGFTQSSLWTPIKIL